MKSKIIAFIGRPNSTFCLNQRTRWTNLKNLIDEDHYKIIGENSKTGEWIIQIKDFSPTGYPQRNKNFE
jgi:hypothetical protein